MLNSKSLSLILGVLIMSFLIVFLVLAWTAPTQTPPLGNVATPLNTSATPQEKLGSLSIPIFYDRDNPTYYINPYGESKLKTLCFGSDCRAGWQEITGVVYRLKANSYSVTGASYCCDDELVETRGCVCVSTCDTHYYSKTVSYTCPAGKAAIVNCTPSGGTDREGNPYCSCSSSDNTVTLKAYVRQYNFGYGGGYYTRVDSCTGYYNYCDVNRYLGQSYGNTCATISCEMTLNCTEVVDVP